MARRFNSVLEDEAEIDFAIRSLRAQGRPIHPDRPKNWDADLAVQATLEFLPKYEPALDAGGDRVSTYLPILADLGYMNMISANLLYPEPVERRGFTTYQRADIEETSFPSGYFGFVACLSVIEHGVNVPKFLKEAARLLRLGGHLFISTDVWWHDVDTGTPDWKVFLPFEISQLIAGAHENNLRPTSEFEFSFKEPIVKHEACEYTFCNLLFRKGD